MMNGMNDQNLQHQNPEADAPLIHQDASATPKKIRKAYVKRTPNKVRTSQRISEEMYALREKLKQLEAEKIEAEQVERAAQREKLITLLDGKKLFDIPIENWEQQIDAIVDLLKA